jgi:hypothetical protein
MAITPDQATMDGMALGYAAVSGSDKSGRASRIQNKTCVLDTWKYDLGDLFDDPGSCWYTEFAYWRTTVPDGSGTVAGPTSLGLSGFDQFYYFGKKLSLWNGFFGFRNDVAKEITDWLAVNPVTDALRVQWFYTLDPVMAATDNYTNTMGAGHPFIMLANMAQQLHGRKIDWWTERCAAVDKAAFDNLQSELVYSDDQAWYQALTVGMLEGYNQMGGISYTTSSGPDHGNFGTCI